MAVIGRKILGQALCCGKGGSSLSSNACREHGGCSWGSLSVALMLGPPGRLDRNLPLNLSYHLVVQGKKTTCGYRILVLEGALGEDLFFYHGETEARTGR